MLVAYRKIQLSMMPEMTSLTLQNVLSRPTIAPAAMPAAMARSMHGSQLQPHASAAYRLAHEPTTYCPAAPMLNRPTLYANRIDSEHMSSGAVLTRVLPRYFICVSARL